MDNFNRAVRDALDLIKEGTDWLNACSMAASRFGIKNISDLESAVSQVCHKFNWYKRIRNRLQLTECSLHENCKCTFSNELPYVFTKNEWVVLRALIELYENYPEGEWSRDVYQMAYEVAGVSGMCSLLKQIKKVAGHAEQLGLLTRDGDLWKINSGAKVDKRIVDLIIERSEA